MVDKCGSNHYPSSKTALSVLILVGLFVSCPAIIGLTAYVDAAGPGEAMISDPSLRSLDKLIDDGTYSTARMKIEKLKQDNPLDPDVCLLAGRLYRKIGLWSLSIVEYETVKNIKPSLAEPYIALSEMHLESLSVEISLSLAREAVRLAPNEVRAKQALIAALIANHNVKEAQEVLSKMITGSASDPEMLYLSSSIHSKMGDVETAKQELEKAMALRPENLNWLFDLCEIYEANGEYDAARKAVSRYVEVAPESIKALSKLAQILELRLYELDSASQIYDRMLLIEPDNAIALAGKERLEKKRKDFASFVKRSLYRAFNWLTTLFQASKG